VFIDDRCVGFAGFRAQQMLAHGRFLYVDDLVTDEASRGSGVGRQLIEWLQAEARRLGCESLQLDSGTHRHGAHAFYFARGMHIASFHFSAGL
jgi:GNAT superfamily N-acetyltransferase